MIITGNKYGNRWSPFVKNGNFISGIDNWSVTSAGLIEYEYGNLKFGTNISAIAGGVTQELVLNIGTSYRVEYKVKSVNTDNMSVNILTNAGPSFVYEGTTITTQDWYIGTFEFTATETNNLIYFRIGKVSGSPIEYALCDYVTIFKL